MESTEKNENKQHYNTRGQKVHDIVLGFLLGIFVCIICGMVGLSRPSFGFLSFIAIAYLIAIVFLFLKQRSYFAIGMILSIILPLITVGGCLYFLA